MGVNGVDLYLKLKYNVYGNILYKVRLGHAGSIPATSTNNNRNLYY